MSLQPLTVGPREGLDEDDVLAALSNPAPRVRHRVELLDAHDQLTVDTLPIDEDTGGWVRWSYRPPDDWGQPGTDTATVRRKASLQLVGDVDDETLLTRRVRIVTEHQAPSGVWVPWHLGVYEPTLPGRTDDGILVRRTLDLAPKEHRWAQVAIGDWVTVDTGTNVLDVITEDLSDEFDETNVAFPTVDDPLLGDVMQFPPDISWMEKWRRMLESIGCGPVHTNEDGRATATDLAALPGAPAEITYGPGHSRIVTAGSVDPALPTIPNVVRFVARRGPSLGGIEGNGWVTVRNQSDGPASIDQRGWEVLQTVDVTATDQTHLETIAAADAQRWFAGGGLRFTGRIGLNPRHSDSDVIGLVKPRLGLSGAWIVTDWTYPLRTIDQEAAVLMDITCEYRVATS